MSFGFSPPFKYALFDTFHLRLYEVSFLFPEISYFCFNSRSDSLSLWSNWFINLHLRFLNLSCRYVDCINVIVGFLFYLAVQCGSSWIFTVCIESICGKISSYYMCHEPNPNMQSITLIKFNQWIWRFCEYTQSTLFFGKAHDMPWREGAFRPNRTLGFWHISHP